MRCDQQLLHMEVHTQSVDTTLITTSEMGIVKFGMINLHQIQFSFDKILRRFCMHKELFANIHNVIVCHDSYLEEKVDGLGRKGLF